MSNTIFHTYDIFDNGNIKYRMECFDFCHKKALECGLSCICIDIGKAVPKLELAGTKWEFVKYYFCTLSKCDYKWKGVKRLFSFIFEES